MGRIDFDKIKETISGYPSVSGNEFQKIVVAKQKNREDKFLSTIGLSSIDELRQFLLPEDFKTKDALYKIGYDFLNRVEEMVWKPAQNPIPKEKYIEHDRKLLQDIEKLIYEIDGFINTALKNPELSKLSAKDIQEIIQYQQDFSKFLSKDLSALGANIGKYQVKLEKDPSPTTITSFLSDIKGVLGEFVVQFDLQDKIESMVKKLDQNAKVVIQNGDYLRMEGVHGPARSTNKEGSVIQKGANDIIIEVTDSFGVTNGFGFQVKAAWYSNRKFEVSGFKTSESIEPNYFLELIRQSNTIPNFDRDLFKTSLVITDPSEKSVIKNFLQRVSKIIAIQRMIYNSFRTSLDVYDFAFSMKNGKLKIVPKSEIIQSFYEGAWEGKANEYYKWTPGESFESAKQNAFNNFLYIYKRK